MYCARAREGCCLELHAGIHGLHGALEARARARSTEHVEWTERALGCRSYRPRVDSERERATHDISVTYERMARRIITSGRRDSRVSRGSDEAGSTIRIDERCDVDVQQAVHGLGAGCDASGVGAHGFVGTTPITRRRSRTWFSTDAQGRNQVDGARRRSASRLTICRPVKQTASQSRPRV